MAPKRQSHLEEPPAVSSGSEEEEASSSEEVSGSEDDEQEPPKEETPSKAKKPRSKPSPTPTKRSPAKRTKKNDSTAENNGSVASEEDQEAKKSGGDDKRLLFQRVWGDDDEIAVLKGLIEYAAKHGTDPAAFDSVAFYEFIKKSLQIDASRQQVSEKVRRLKKKYINNLKRGYSPTKPHELEAFQLSKRIWTEEDLKLNGTAKSNKKGKSKMVSSPVAPVEAQTAEIDRKEGGSLGSLCLSRMVGFDKGLPEHVVKNGLALIPDSKRAELEAKWEKLNVAELELFVKKSQLISEQAKLILEALKSSDH